jgi:hypothetical protein
LLPLPVYPSSSAPAAEMESVGLILDLALLGPVEDQNREASSGLKKSAEHLGRNSDAAKPDPARKFANPLVALFRFVRGSHL